MSRRQTPTVDDVPRGDTLAVRPYALTGGRTRTLKGLSIESLVAATAVGVEQMATLPSEYRRIVRLATIPVSVAEAAAHTATMVGVTKVLIGDLVVNGLLTVRQGVATQRPSAQILERVLHGLEAL
jgi:hypothetical protein